MIDNLDELSKHKKKISIELQQLERELKKCDTNNVLHVILTVVTCGIWILVWPFVADSNKHKRRKLEALIDESHSALIDLDNNLIPAARAKSMGSTTSTVRNEIDCPWCAEKILSKAKICKHCRKEV